MTGSYDDPFVFNWMAMNQFIAIWVVGRACHQLLPFFLPGHTDTSIDKDLSATRHETTNNTPVAMPGIAKNSTGGKAISPAQRFINLAPEKQRNAVTYVLQLFVTSVALVIQLGAGRELILYETVSNVEQLEWGALAIQAISVLYVWELIYRQTIGGPLLFHHIVSLLLIQLVMAAFFDTHHLIYLRFAIIFGFHATTEQTSFVALFCFRLDLLSKRAQSWMFLFSAVQTILVKTTITVATCILFTNNVQNFRDDNLHGTWGSFWIVSTIPLILSLLMAQVYSSWILFVLGMRCRKSCRLISARAKRKDIHLLDPSANDLDVTYRVAQFSDEFNDVDLQDDSDGGDAEVPSILRMPSEKQRSLLVVD